MSRGKPVMRWPDGFVVAAVGVLMASSVVLWTQNRSLKEELGAVRANSAMVFEIGDRLPDVALTNDAGTRVSLREISSGRTLIAFVTTTCPFCEESLPVWRTVSNGRTGARFALVSFDTPAATRTWTERWGLDFERWYPASAADAQQLGVSAVPVTIAAREGRVEFAVAGSLRSKRINGTLSRLLGE